jgi:hypothetical protein
MTCIAKQSFSQGYKNAQEEIGVNINKYIFCINVVLFLFLFSPFAVNICTAFCTKLCNTSIQMQPQREIKIITLWLGMMFFLNSELFVVNFKIHKNINGLCVDIKYGVLQ